MEIAFFIDPPYTSGGKKAGSRLYAHSELDHDELFRLCSELAGDFLMTYSNDETTQQLARKHKLAMREIAMKNTHHARMTELLVGCVEDRSPNLDWLIYRRSIFD